ncbi:hypothetical protein A4X06_0g1156 [Tilletia controversa]|uniref:Uncharacterized protein n=1 Tax=Tilletia controversa TaxID=13291 RepID=A0A8X7MYY8_9BASI|nr:hypothetical protein A4X06_0g1156 [Tilletia controversa]
MAGPEGTACHSPIFPTTSTRTSGAVLIIRLHQWVRRSLDCLVSSSYPTRRNGDAMKDHTATSLRNGLSLSLSRS